MIVRESDLTVPIGEALDFALLDARTNIQTGGGLSGGYDPIHPLTPIILEILTGRGHSGEPLMGLIPSLTKGGEGNYFTASANAGETGTTAPGAVFANSGTRRTFLILQFLRSRGKNRGWVTPGEPMRKIFPDPAERISFYEEPFLKYVMGGANA